MGCVLVEGPSPRGLSKILRTRSHLLRTNQSSRTSGTEIRLAQLHPHSAAEAHRLGVFSGANGASGKIAIRKSRITQVDLRDFSLLHWTDRFYFEVCADPAVCAALPGEKSAAEKV